MPSHTSTLVGFLPSVDALVDNKKVTYTQTFPTLLTFIELLPQCAASGAGRWRRLRRESLATLLRMRMASPRVDPLMLGQGSVGTQTFATLLTFIGSLTNVIFLVRYSRSWT